MPERAPKKVPTLVKLDPDVKAEAQAHIAAGHGKSLASVVETSLRRFNARARSTDRNKKETTAP